MRLIYAVRDHRFALHKGKGPPKRPLVENYGVVFARSYAALYASRITDGVEVGREAGALPLLPAAAPAAAAASWVVMVVVHSVEGGHGDRHGVR
jgi:hypothetical protein